MKRNHELLAQDSFTVEPLRQEDMGQLRPILEQHVRHPLTGVIEQTEVEEIIGCMAGSKDKEERVRRYFVARSQDGKVLGCMAWSGMNRVMENHFDDLEPRETAELLNAFVDREYFRGGGIGRKLFERICQEASNEGKKFVVLNSGPRYMRSWGFYDVMCDQDRGFIKDLYGPGRDAKTWIKRL